MILYPTHEYIYKSTFTVPYRFIDSADVANIFLLIFIC